MKNVDPKASDQPVGPFAVVWEGLVVAVTAAMFAIAWAMRLGPDINFDFLTYHLYIGMHASGNSLSSNFFPAGTSSYLLPYANWPLSAMIAAHWPARAIGAVLATMQSLAAIATWTVALQLFGGRTVTHLAYRLLGTVIGMLAPLVLAAIGSSHVDLLTAIPVVFGLALLLKALAAPRRRVLWMFIAGACFGAATMLKLTNVTMALAAGITVIILVLVRPDVRFVELLAFAAGGLIGAGVTYGYWGYLLWREFGNPFFPLYDQAFKPPPLAVEALPRVDAMNEFLSRLWTFRDGMHQRFLAHGWNEWLLRPLYMLDPSNNVYVELRAPDARFLVLCCRWRWLPGPRSSRVPCDLPASVAAVGVRVCGSTDRLAGRADVGGRQVPMERGHLAGPLDRRQATGRRHQPADDLCRARQRPGIVADAFRPSGVAFAAPRHVIDQSDQRTDRRTNVETAGGSEAPDGGLRLQTGR